MAKKKKAETSPLSDSQPAPATEYRLPSYEALRAWGFAPEGSLPATASGAYAGKQGSTSSIWIYPGYLGSPKIEIILIDRLECYFTVGPPGPNPKANPKHRITNGREFEALLHAAGYPDKAETKRLQDEDKRKKEAEKVEKERLEAEAKAKKEANLKARNNAGK
jgi:hypothetical protein